MRDTTNDVQAQLKALRLNGMAAAWADLTEQGGDATLASSRWLVEHLLQAECCRRPKTDSLKTRVPIQN